MEKKSDEAYEFKGTRFHVRAFVDPLQREKPVFVIEEGVGNENSLDMNRVEIAKELSSRLYKNPEEITWLELSPDRSLKQFEFQYTHTDTLNRDLNDMTLAETREAAQKNSPSAYEVTRYNTQESEVSRQEVQAQVGEALEPYAMRQNEEFKQMKSPATTIDIGEMRSLPSQHDFENEPTLSY